MARQTVAPTLTFLPSRLGVLDTYIFTTFRAEDF